MRKQKNIQHPYNARHDERLAALVGDYGAAGYGAYWMTLEMLHSEEGERIEYSDKRKRRLSAQAGIGYELFCKLLDDAIHVYELLLLKDGFLAAPLKGAAKKKKAKASTEEPPLPISELSVSSEGQLSGTPASEAIAADATSLVFDPAAEADETSSEIGEEDDLYSERLKYKPKKLGRKHHKSYRKLLVWMAENAPRVSQMKEPFTIYQVNELKKRYRENEYCSMLIAMHENENLLTEHTSAWKTLLQVMEDYVPDWMVEEDTIGSGDE